MEKHPTDLPPKNWSKYYVRIREKNLPKEADQHTFKTNWVRFKKTEDRTLRPCPLLCKNCSLLTALNSLHL